MEELIHTRSILELYKNLRMGTPPHPLITVVRQWPESQIDLKNTKFTADFFFIAMKGNYSGAFQYGRNSYDFSSGSMVFVAPGQAVTFSSFEPREESGGWALMFHPNFIRKSELGKNIQKYRYFEYQIKEALHLSEKERQFLDQQVNKIEEEISQNNDKHSQDLIIHLLETILKYSNRFYDRQFYSRTNLNHDHISRFEKFLNDYFNSGQQRQKGIPTVEACGQILNMSGYYLSDLLRVETGKGAKEHIHAYVVERAKTELLNSKATIGEVAFDLGFSYQQHFSKLFKARTGMSPSQFRNMN